MSLLATCYKMPHTSLALHIINAYLKKQLKLSGFVAFAVTFF